VNLWRGAKQQLFILSKKGPRLYFFPDLNRFTCCR